MKRYSNKNHSKLNIILGAIFIAGLYFLTLSIESVFDMSFLPFKITREMISILPALYISCILLFKEDTFDALAITIYSLLGFFYELDGIKQPLFGLISIGLVFLSSIIHFIKFRPKFRLGSFFIPIAIILICGIITSFQNKNRLGEIGQTLVLRNILVGLFLLYFEVFFVSSIKKHSLKELSFFFILLAILLLGMNNINYYFLKIQNSVSRSDTPYLFNHCLLVLIIPFILISILGIETKKDIIQAVFAALVLFAILYDTWEWIFENTIFFVFMMIALIIIGICKNSNKLYAGIASFFVLALIVLIPYVKTVHVERVSLFQYDIQKIAQNMDLLKQCINDIKNREGQNLIFGQGVYYTSLVSASATFIYNDWLMSHLYDGLGYVGLGAFTLSSIIAYFKLLRVRNKAGFVGAFVLLGTFSLSFFSVLSSYFELFVFIILIGILTEYEVNEKLLCELGTED